MVIYKTTNLLDGKFYIGKDEKNDPNYFGSGMYLLRAINKYGKENFIKEIIDTANTSEELCVKEIYWIEQTDAINKGYNLTDGGNGGNTMKYKSDTEINEWKRKIGEKSKGHILSKESRKKISDARQGMQFTDEHKENIKKARAKQVITEEHKKHISEANMGKKCSEETKRKISEATKGKNKGKSPVNKGVPMSQEQKEKVSQSKKGKCAGRNNPSYGKKWLNNGIKHIYVKKEDIEYYLDKGYKFGMLKKK